MPIRLLICLVLALTVSACSDRYAFWNGDDALGSYAGTKPNLGDVPDAPNVDPIKAEMEQIRQRMEQERENAYLAAQGMSAPLVQEVPATSWNTETLMQNSSDIQVSPLQAPAQMQQNVSGNVVYNYGSSGDTGYVYGFSPVNIRATGAGQAPAPYVSGDPSVTVDMSALGSHHQYQTSYRGPGLSGEPAVFFGYGSARIGSGDRQKLQAMADRISSGQQSVVVIGYASRPTGISNIATSREVNLRMSAHRAGAVMRELANLGVDPATISLTAYGDTMATGDQSHDQRVDIKFSY